MPTATCLIQLQGNQQIRPKIFPGVLILFWTLSYKQKKNSSLTKVAWDTSLILLEVVLQLMIPKPKRFESGFNGTVTVSNMAIKQIIRIARERSMKAIFGQVFMLSCNDSFVNVCGFTSSCVFLMVHLCTRFLVICSGRQYLLILQYLMTSLRATYMRVKTSQHSFGLSIDIDCFLYFFLISLLTQVDLITSSSPQF